LTAFDADPARRQIDDATNANWDKLIPVYERGLAGAKKEFGRQGGSIHSVAADGSPC
jgi:hypothetical protein